ncbi:pyridoxamine 5'-phosphate oxidase family protein [Nocardiopsis rhodophaea]
MTQFDAPALFDAALATVRQNAYGFLATTAAPGPHVRLVRHIDVDDDATVWIGTSPRSRKVTEVAAHAEVAYAIEDRNAVAYVTIQARADVIDDLAARVAKWHEESRRFFPGGPEGDDFVLLRLTPHRIEVMDFTRRIHPDPYGLVPAVIERAADGTWVEHTAVRGS